MSAPHEPCDIAAAAQLACLLEASAPKPGNVAPGRPFGDTTYEDFLASAAAIGTPLGNVGGRPVGRTIHHMVVATRRWTRANTNLGIVLLFAPLARAASECACSAEISANGPGVLRAELRARLGTVLRATTVADAREAYAAIRLASPGGLGTSDAQDVATEPTVTLLEAMRLAAHRDAVAREYVTDFETTFEVAAPALDAARADGLGWNDAIVETYLTLLAAQPDTHIARRAGVRIADDVARRARTVLENGGVRSAQGRAAIAALDAALRDAENSTNPGATADLTAAAIFVVLLSDGWHSTNGGFDAAAR